MSKTFGLSATGFIAKQQQDIKSEMEQSLKDVFGQNINLSSASNFGQFVSIQSERETLIWQLAEAVYLSRSPSGAEGTSVDDLLAMNNMRRLPASATRTNTNVLTSINGIKKYGLILYGVPGTVIPQNSIIQNGSSPPFQLKTDVAVTIAASVNAIQSLFMSNIPDAGNFQLFIDDTAGNNLSTPSLPYNIQAQKSVVTFASIPVAGNFTLRLTRAGAFLNTTTLGFAATSLQIQSAIQALAGYSSVTVTGTMPSFEINWGNVPAALLSVDTNTTTVAIAILDSLQSKFNNLHDVTSANYPYTDVQVATGASGFNFNFGLMIPVSGQPDSGARPQALMTFLNTLMSGFAVTNINIANTVDGAEARAIASATGLVNGPTFISSGSIATIGTPVSGWNTVLNQLDCITGTNIESDTDAILRRAANLQARANGPLASIVEKVRAIVNVITAIGFENDNEAALQRVNFPIQPVSGAYKLVLNGSPSPTINYNDTAAQIQTKLRTISGYTNLLVTGNLASDFLIDFNGSFGGQEQPLMSVSNNTTGGSVLVSFDRPGKSFEVVADGGDQTAIAQSILGSKPAGIQTFGALSTTVFDQFNNPYNIKFSRPAQVPIYVAIVLQTDLFSAIQPKFDPASIRAIQQDIVSLGSLVGIGGLVIGRGTNGLVGAFNNVPGILNYTLFFGLTPSPVSDANIQMQAEEAPVFQTFNVAVSYS